MWQGGFGQSLRDQDAAFEGRAMRKRKRSVAKDASKRGGLSRGVRQWLCGDGLMWRGTRGRLAEED